MDVALAADGRGVAELRGDGLDDGCDRFAASAGDAAASHSDRARAARIVPAQVESLSP